MNSCANCNWVDMESRAWHNLDEPTREERNLNLTKIARENVENLVTTKFVLQRDATMSTDAAKGGLVPLMVQDIVKPLREALIFDKVGIDIKTGLHGEFIWSNSRKARGAHRRRSCGTCNAKNRFQQTLRKSRAHWLFYVGNT